jgi:ribosomal-protein-alanine N-acetyltransferase
MLTHKGTQTIRTERLILRRFCTEDSQAMFDNWASDDEVSKYLTWPTHSNLEISQWVINDWVSSYEKPDFYLWAIVFEGQAIGSISVVGKDDDVKKAHIGYCIGRNWWRKGIMSEALKAVMDYLFDEVGMNRIEACYDPNNPNSGRVMAKCGMKYEGTHRQSGRNNQGICDEAFYGLLKSDRIL